METTKEKVSVLLRASCTDIDIDNLLSDPSLIGLSKDVWREGEPINSKKNYTNSGVILKIFDGDIDDIREGILGIVVPYLERNQSALQLLKSKMSMMIFEIEFNLEKTDLFMLGFNLPKRLLSLLGDLDLDLDVNQCFFD